MKRYCADRTGNHFVCDEGDWAYYSDAQAEIARLTAEVERRWIPVTERLPDEDDSPIVVWAPNMPLSAGRCLDGLYTFYDMEEVGCVFGGDAEWMREHWSLWTRLMPPTQAQGE